VDVVPDYGSLRGRVPIPASAVGSYSASLTIYPSGHIPDLSNNGSADGSADDGAAVVAPAGASGGDPGLRRRRQLLHAVPPHARQLLHAVPPHARQLRGSEDWTSARVVYHRRSDLDVVPGQGTATEQAAEVPEPGLGGDVVAPGGDTTMLQPGVDGPATGGDGGGGGASNGASGMVPDAPTMPGPSMHDAGLVVTTVSFTVSDPRPPTADLIVKAPAWVSASKCALPGSCTCSLSCILQTDLLALSARCTLGMWPFGLE
jgi:hypothetical protein